MKGKGSKIYCHFKLSKVEGLAQANFKCKGFFFEVVFDGEDLVSETTVDTSKQVVDFKGEFATFEVKRQVYDTELVIITIKAAVKKDKFVDLATLKFPLRCIPMNQRVSQKFEFENTEAYTTKIKAFVEGHVCDQRKLEAFDTKKGKVNMEVLAEYMESRGGEVKTRKPTQPVAPLDTKRTMETLAPARMLRQQPQPQRPHDAVPVDIPPALLQSVETAIAMAPPEVWESMANPQFIREALAYYRVR